MAIPPLDQRLNEMVQASDPMPMPVPEQQPEAALAEDIQVAAVGKLGLEILEPLLRKGARAAKEPKLVDQPIKPVPAPVSATVVEKGVTTPKPVEIKVKPAKKRTSCR